MRNRLLHAVLARDLQLFLMMRFLKSQSGFFSIRWLVFLVLIGIAAFAGYFAGRRDFLSNFPLSRLERNAPSKTVDIVDIQFDRPAALKGWREYAFNKKSDYKIAVTPNGETALHAGSRDAYSSLFKLINIPLETHPVLAWQWRAVKFPAGKKSEKLEAAGENDFSIRVCAVFAKNNPFVTEMIQYIWDDRFPVGTHGPSPYSKNVRMLVVQSGPPSPTGEWSVQKRDLIQDYEMLFGKIRYNNLRAIAITSNSDDTHTESEAYIKRIWVESKNSDLVSYKKRHKIREKFRALWQKTTHPFKSIGLFRRKKDKGNNQPLPGSTATVS